VGTSFDVKPELHVIAPAGCVLLHDDGIRSAWQWGTSHDAMRCPRRQHVRFVASARAPGNRQDQRHARLARKTDGISIHRRLIERRKGDRSFDRRGQDASYCTSQRHVFLPVERFSKCDGNGSCGFKRHYLRA
jgi:hypothetical protein